MKRTALYFVVCLLSIFALGLQADAGSYVCKQVGRGKVELLNDLRQGTTVLFIWGSTAQTDGNGICHSAVVSPGDSASYTFTEEQLKGNLHVMAFIKFSDFSGKGQVAMGPVKNKEGCHISLSSIIEWGESGYADSWKLNDSLKMLGINNFTI